MQQRLIASAFLALTFLAISPAPSSAAGPFDDLVRSFERTCVANAGIVPLFNSERIKAAFKKAGGNASLRVFWTPAEWCKVEFHAITNVSRGPEVSARVQAIAVAFAARVKGTVEHSRPGKRNESFRVKSPVGEYSLYADADRSDRITGMWIGKRK